MKAIGIITEYNPFHNGHLYQTELLREKQAKEVALVSVMSGSFTQRGEATVMDKWTRAKTAIQGGVDLVLELPTIFSVASADGFAIGGLGILSAAAVIGEIAFGSEAGEITALQRIADYLHASETDSEIQSSIQTHMREGLGYAASLSQIVQQNLGESEAKVMQEANNILGISYLKAIHKLPQDHKIKATTHARQGASHLDSASQIRRILATYQTDPAAVLKAIDGKVPTTTAAALAQAAKSGSLLLPHDLSELVYSLIRRSNAEELKKFVGMGDGLAERLLQAASRLPGEPSSDASVYERLVAASRARQLSQARVQRALATLLLGITEKDMVESLEAGPQYIRVLAFNKRGRYILKQMSKYARLPLITKASDFREHNDKGPIFRRQYELDLMATDLRSVLCREKDLGQDFDRAVWIR